MSAQPSADTHQLGDHSTQSGHGLRVLLVDDSQIQRLLLTHLLKQLGHTVSVASDGFEALSAVQSDGSFDVILMDCQMPLMDGLQASRPIREMGRVTGQETAIIGMSSAATAEECFMAGMDEFLHKPLSKPMLNAVLGRRIRQEKSPADRRSQFAD